MNLTQADIDSDFEHIKGSWADTNAVETVTIDGDPYSVLRVGQVAMEEMVEAGLQDAYQFSVYLRAVGAPEILRQETEVVFGDEGTLRVEAVRRDPTKVYLRLDLVDQWEE